MANIENGIWMAIQAKGRGGVFFPSDFMLHGELKAVGKNSEQMFGKGYIICFTIYIHILRLTLKTLCIDAIHKQITETIACRDKIHIVSTTINNLGVTQVIMDVISMTNGVLHKVGLENNHSIQLHLRSSQKSHIYQSTCRQSTHAEMNRSLRKQTV